jgi:hypothetical protein
MTGRHVSEPKGFQRATAEAALATLTNKVGPRRFLVADEVGLGKTIVARTVISEMIKRRRRPLVVFYVTSNLNIAHQNRGKLLEFLETEEEQDRASAASDRLTLAANPQNRPEHEKLHLYTLTPDTSVPMYRRRGGFGRLEERALIFRLLSGRFPSLNTNAFYAKCKGNQAGEASWSWALQRHEYIEGVRELQNRFIDALTKDQHVKFAEVNADTIARAAESERASRLMGAFRTALAMAVLQKIKPDLVIFDEFQKFREILIDPPRVLPDPVAEALRGGSRSGDHAVLLLSATPYRLYSSRQDEAAGLSHHEDFFQLVRFLFSPDTKEPLQIERAFREFGIQMLARETPDFGALAKLRNEIEQRLAPVLSRTERPGTTASTSGQNFVHPHSEIAWEDLRVFKHWVARLQDGKKRGRGSLDLKTFAVPYWLSIPLPIQMMGSGYVAWRDAEKVRRRREEPIFRSVQRDRLEAPKRWPHPQLRELHKMIPSARLALPWVAPSLPWWDLLGPWAEAGSKGGKLLIFTRFKAVPPALASLLSFTLEAAFAQRLRRNYRRAGEAQPLQFKEDRPTLPALFFPSPTLIACTDPRRDKPANLAEVRASMRRQIGELLQKLSVKVRRSGGKRAIWKLLPAIERSRERAMPESPLPSWQELRGHLRDTSASEVMKEILAQWNDVPMRGWTRSHRAKSRPWLSSPFRVRAWCWDVRFTALILPALTMSTTALY